MNTYESFTTILRSRKQPESIWNNESGELNDLSVRRMF